MSDEPREPIEPELITNPPKGGPSVGPAEFPIHINPVDGQPYIRLGEPQQTPPRRRSRINRLVLIPAVLFPLTILTIFQAGCRQFQGNHGMLLRDPHTGRVAVGYDLRAIRHDALLYVAGVMGILICHEMGHYLQSRRYRVPATLPIFIPMPIGPLGTMGAVIVQQPGVADRKMLFDIAISGPLAGLVVALPLAWWGVQHGTIVTAPPGAPMTGFNDPLILRWMIRAVFGPLQPNQDILINPVYFAAWVGMLITGLNLVPIGQLDGGHLLYCLVGRKAHVVARLLFYFAIAAIAFNFFFGNKSYIGWILMLGLIRLIGTKHPPTSNDNVPLGPVRIVLGWLTLAFFFIGFTPAPFRLGDEPAPPPAPTKVEREVVSSTRELGAARFRPIDTTPTP